MIATLLSDFWPYIAGAVAVVFAGWKMKRAGRNDVMREIQQDRLKRAEEARDAVAKEQTEIAGLSSRDIADRLRRRDGDIGGV